MLLKREKPYKALPPEKTIEKIKGILEESGFRFSEKRIKGNPFFYATTLGLVNPGNDQRFFTTYGKGSSTEWASASAWGEMIERIQNLAFYMIFIYPSRAGNNKQVRNGFEFYPDEKVFSSQENHDKQFYKNLESLTGTKIASPGSGKKITGIPFYNLFEKRSEYFPVRAMQVAVGSNGMCSGNTPEEAMIQGISEVFERFVLKSLYINPICPPEIPIVCFEGTEIMYKINQLTSQSGYKIRIKDCSLGRGYPIVGVLLENNENRYAFHLGADPCPITALERCLNEMFQGGSVCFQSIDELKKNIPYNLASAFWRKQLNLTIKAYAGQWPPSILKDDPDYEFKGFDHPVSISDTDDLQYLLQILKKEERKIFIRNNSFLGQPAYYIYIPGMSEITGFPDDSFLTAFIDFDKYLPLISNLKKSSRHQRAEMMKVLFRYIEASPEKQFRIADYFMYNQNHSFSGLSPDQFPAMIKLSALTGDIRDHFSQREIRSNPFLNPIFEKDSSFKPSELFNHMNIPECFDCSGCLFRNSCNLPYISEVWDRIKEKMVSFYINNNGFAGSENVQA